MTTQSRVTEKTLAELAEDSLQKWGDRPALWFEGRWWSSGELSRRAKAWAGALADDLAVRPGDRVAVMLPNTPEVGIAYAACWRIGAVVTPVVFLLGGHELAHVLRDSGAVVVVTSPEFLPAVLAAAHGTQIRSVVVVGGEETPGATAVPHLVSGSQLDRWTPREELAERHSDDLAALLYTGGTTGRAKGVMLTHAGLASAGVGGAQLSFVPGATRTIMPLPLSHAYGLLITCIGLATVEPSDMVLQRWFDADAFLHLVAEHRPSRATVVPSMLALLLTRPLEEHDLSSLRFVSSGGAPLPPQVQEEFELRVPGVKVIEGYGMTETSALCTSSHPDDRKLGTVGTAAPGYEVRIADPATDEPLPAGGEGEVQVRGAGVMAGYWHDGEATDHALRGGWLHTGDVGVLDDEGYLRIVDRLKDLVIRGGFNIYPRDIEDGLVDHPEVALAAVVGRPDPVYGEEVVAFVQLRPGSTLTGPDLVAWARTRFAANKYPREVIVVDSVPLTSVGKIDRKAVRARLS